MTDSNNPLASLEEWEGFLKDRYPEGHAPATTTFQASNPAKKKEQFRNYDAYARPSVREFYRLNHRHQTYDFVQAKRKEFLSLNRRQMSSQYPRARIASTSPSAPPVSAATAAPSPPAPVETTISCSRRAMRAGSADYRRAETAEVCG